MKVYARTYSEGMDGGLFARAAGVQLVCVAVLFVLLLALPLPEDFFRDYGGVTGPGAWLLSAAVTTRVLRLPARTGILATFVSGAAAGLVGVAIDHTLGLVIGVMAFGAVCAARRIAVPAPMV